MGFRRFRLDDDDDNGSGSGGGDENDVKQQLNNKTGFKGIDNKTFSSVEFSDSKGGGKSGGGRGKL